MRLATGNLWIEDGDEPAGRVYEFTGLAELGTSFGQLTNVSLIGDITPATEQYLRRLATTADELADAVAKAYTERSRE